MRSMKRSATGIRMVIHPANDNRSEGTPSLPHPEDVLAQWLLTVPPGGNIEAHARAQIELIDRSCLHHRDLDVLRTLLSAVAGGPFSITPQTNL